MGTLTMTAGASLRTLAQAGIFLIIARILGSKEYGAYAAVLALAGTLGNFGGFGAQMILLRDVSRVPSTFSPVWSRTLGTTIASAPVLMIVYLIMTRILLPDISWIVSLSLGIAEILFIPAIYNAVTGCLGLEHMGRAATLALLPVIFRFICAVLLIPMSTLLPHSTHLTVWSLFYGMSAATSSVIVINYVHCLFGRPARIQPSDILFIVKEGIPFAAGGAALKLYSDIDKTMLAKIASFESAGIYSAAYRVIDMASLPISSFFAAASSRFFRAGLNGTQNASRHAVRILPLPLFYAACMGIVIYVSAPLMPAILGNDFSCAVEALRWLAWLPLVVTPRRILQTALGSSGRQNTAVLVVACGALLNITLNLLSIPRWDWKGAVIATYASDLFMLCILLITTAEPQQ